MNIKLNIEYDLVCDILYVKLINERVFNSRELATDLVVNYNYTGHVVGVKLLKAIKADWKTLQNYSVLPECIVNKIDEWYIEKQAVSFCKGWSDNFYDEKSLSRAEVTNLLVQKQELAIPIVKKILDPNFKNRYNVSYIKTSSRIQDGCLVAIGRLGRIADSLKNLLDDYKDHPYYPFKLNDF